MATKNPRINITLEEATAEFLTKLAKQEDRSVSNLVKELVLEALDRREDMMLSAVAVERDSGNDKKISHDDAWD
jgi:predicted DNA-binding protein